MSAPFALDDFGRRPYSDMHAGFVHALQRFTTWPAPEEYDELTRHVPQAADVRLPRFVTEDRAQLRQVGGYEQHVAQLCAVPTRPGSWHDFFNMSVWAHFPKVRWALNALHVSTDVGPKDPRNGRAPAQNLAATFDEAGMIVVSSSTSILEELRGLRFKQAFWARREELLATTRFWVVGHGMLEALLEPHPGMSARSLLLHVPTLPLEGRASRSGLHWMRWWPSASTAGGSTAVYSTPSRSWPFPALAPTTAPPFTRTCATSATSLGHGARPITWRDDISR